MYVCVHIEYTVPVTSMDLMTGGLLLDVTIYMDSGVKWPQYSVYT